MASAPGPLEAPQRDPEAVWAGTAAPDARNARRTGASIIWITGSAQADLAAAGWSATGRAVRLATWRLCPREFRGDTRAVSIQQIYMHVIPAWSRRAPGSQRRPSLGRPSAALLRIVRSVSADAQDPQPFVLSLPLPLSTQRSDLLGPPAHWGYCERLRYV
jgi:hypothetical protein